MRKENENENGKNKKHWRESVKDKKFYLYTVIGCAVALLSLVIVAVTMSIVGEDKPSVNTGTNVEQPDDPNDPTGGETPDDGTGTGGTTGGDDQPVDGQPGDMVLPVEGVTVSTEYEFYYNQTLNRYYLHKGIDFAADAGVEVVAAQGGVIESIYTDELLTGTEITVDHGDGLKSVYRFVNAAEGLEVGASVERGQVIATVAEAVGDEYKDGAHLHFEVLKDNKNVDPTTYLTLEEK
ncbi:MAG: M23 family metallopeptidase [Clostridia bacterium]|nr:M23 family metallopeptidase [Clostridia bacterium]